ncbi:MAG: anthranilate phosphoribosyltransferase [Methylacidiphilales bacterium]|nr:anthranilate phosphoribosyltransferase [Candidatus Methylacidiphilales bacterium]MDW8349673.1 anthranilate phosphoribosyltransferase [Verrucomicrobiae bacterium]
MLSLQEAAKLCHAGQTTPLDEIPTLIRLLLDPNQSSEDKKAYLLALKQRGETADELAAFALCFRELATPPPASLLALQTDTTPFLDSCGTGGGALPLFNVSTATAFVLIAAGLTITKHGNRAITKSSGSADVLEALGLRIDLSPDQIEAQLRTTHFAFLFAPQWHPAFKAIAPIRKELASAGHRTIFNLLGPLLNPLRPRIQILGVFKKEHGPLFHAALKKIGCQRFAVVYGELPDGRPCGEVSPYGLGQLWTSHPHIPISLQNIQPHYAVEKVFVAHPQESAQLIEAVLQGKEQGPARSFLVANAAVALTIAEKTSDITSGYRLAAELIDSRAAWKALKQLRDWQQAHLQ